jgi:hypothetical protein
MRKATGIVLGLFGLAMLAGSGPAPLWARQRSTQQMLAQFVRTELQGDGDRAGATARFSYALVDLNGDSIPEAIVRIIDPQDCGSGGCNLYVLRRRGLRYQIVSHTTISRPPIRVLPSRSHGWLDLGVFVEGGGILPGYEAVLSFNGRSYPLNPTVAPARRARGPIRGRIVISPSTRTFSVH